MHGTEEKMKNFNMMKKLLALTLGAAMLLAVMTGCGKKDTAQEPADDQQQQQEEQQSTEPATLLEQIKAKGKVVVGTEAQYAPYEFKDLDANFAGCDMWLAQQIADSLGVELEVVDMAFDGIIPAVQSGQVDLGIAAFTNTPERAEEIDFSDLYETSAQLLIVKAGNADTYSTKESLVGLKVGAQKGTIQSQLIQSALPESELFELEKYPALALEVQNGNIAGLVVDQAVGEALVASSNGALEVSNFTFTAEEASFGKSVVIAKGNEDLVAVVNEVINKVTAEANKAKREEFWANVEVGKQYKGVVKSLTSYGAFVDVGGVDGLCHISELSWNNIKHPSEVVKVGDEIEVYVKSYDPENQKVSLGYKKEEDNPWVKLENEVPVGTEFTAPVVSITKFGAFVRIMPGIDGLVHISEISNERVNKVSDVLKVGDEVRVKLTAVDFDRKRISLSMKACLDENGEDAE